MATSHGKQPCDGIGGTVKKLVTKKSLQQDTAGHVWKPEDMFSYCQKNIKEINFIYLDKEDVTTTRKSLEKRWKNLIAVPGTRSFHEYILLGKNTVGAKKCSEDEQMTLTHNLTKKDNCHRYFCIRSCQLHV